MPAMRPNDPRNPKPAVDPIQQFQQNYRRQIMQMNYPKEYAAAMEDQKAQEQRDRESQKRIGNPVGGVTTVGLMAGPGRELSSINTWGEFDMAPKSKASSPFAPGAGYQATDPSDPYYSKRPRRPMRLAEGGPVEGPGGPKDDLINAKLSDGEFVMPAEVVEFYGLDRLHKMMAKAKEGLNEIKPAPQALPTPLPVTMPQPTPAFAYGGMAQSMPVPGYAEGGLKEVDNAISAQQRAFDSNKNPTFFDDYIYPEPGWRASMSAERATGAAMEEVDRFLAAQDEFNRLSDEQSAARQTRIRNMTSPEWLKNNPEWLASAAQQIEDEQGPMAGPQRLTAVVGDQAYGPTMTDSPAFQPRPAAPAVAAPAVAAMQQPQNIIRRLPPNPYSVETGYSITPMDPVAPAPAVSPSPTPQVPFVADPATRAAMRSRRADLRAGQPLLTAPEGLLAQGRAVLDALPTAQAPMDVPLMRPAPLTMTEKEQQAKPMSRSRTPESNPEFEAALAGLTGMQKRRARAGLQMEEATFQRNQGRAAIEQANIDARDAAKQADADRRAADATAAAQEWWKQQQQIGQNFDMARENRNINNAAALNAAEQARADQRALMEAQQKAQADAAARQITMQPIPGTPGYNVAMMGGSRVPGTPLMQAQTTPGPFREGLGRTTYTPMEDPATAPKPPTVRKSAPRPGATKEAPEWEYATMSDNTTRPITIENPRPDQMSERFKHQYGKAPQTEADWTDAYYLTTGQPRPKTTAAAAPAAGTAAPRAKIKTVTPVS